MIAVILKDREQTVKSVLVILCNHGAINGYLEGIFPGFQR